MNMFWRLSLHLTNTRRVCINLYRTNGAVSAHLSELFAFLCLKSNKIFYVISEKNDGFVFKKWPSLNCLLVSGRIPFIARESVN